MKITIRSVVKNGLLLFVFVCGVGNAEEAYMGIGYGGMKTHQEYSFTDTQDNISLQVGNAISPQLAIELTFSRSLSSDAPDIYIQGSHDDAFWSRLVERNPGMTIAGAREQYPNPQSSTRLTQDVIRTTASIFGVYKTRGNPYLKTKAGLTAVVSQSTYHAESFEGQMVALNGSVLSGTLDDGDIDFDFYAASKEDSDKEKTTDFSVGFGAGYQLSDGLFAEIELTRFNSDTEYYSVTLNYFY